MACEQTKLTSNFWGILMNSLKMSFSFRMKSCFAGDLSTMIMFWAILLTYSMRWSVVSKMPWRTFTSSWRQRQADTLMSVL